MRVVCELLSRERLQEVLNDFVRFLRQREGRVLLRSRWGSGVSDSSCGRRYREREECGEE